MHILVVSDFKKQLSNKNVVSDFKRQLSKKNTDQQSFRLYAFAVESRIFVHPPPYGHD